MDNATTTATTTGTWTITRETRAARPVFPGHIAMIKVEDVMVLRCDGNLVASVRCDSEAPSLALATIAGELTSWRLAC